MAEHGFLRPNPALLNLEERKRKPTLAHELGAGARCSTCGDRCPGFELHFWRKVCLKCRCSKAEHNVVDEHDPGFYFVGKIFDRPLRSRAEELEFCYGDDLSSDDDGGGGGGTGGRRVGPGGGGGRGASIGRRAAGPATTSKGGAKQQERLVKFDWIPPHISKSLARRYLEQLPEKSVPIVGSEGAQHRKQQLEKQFPVHDIEPKECHELTSGEIQSMEDYIAKVKEHVVGQGVVTEIEHDDDESFPPPPSSEFLDALSSQLESGAVISPPQPHSGHLPAATPALPPKPGQQPIFHAKPYAPPSSASAAGATGTPSSLVFPSGPKPYGSTSSSLASSRNESPSPTSSTEDPGASPSAPALVRPSKFSPAHRAPHHGQHLHPNPQLNPNPQENPHPGATPDPARACAGGKALRVEGRGARTCQGCHEALQPGDVAVVAERAGPGKLWHPQCFKCSTCQEILVDLLYYFEAGHVYCARDYAAKVKIPRCSACDELIFAAEYTGAEQKTWHLKHFCCYLCDRALAGHKYIAISGQPHCLMCYQNTHGKVCRTCGEYINPEDQRVSLKDEHWHARDSCFCCAVCRTSLIGQKMAKKNGLILCSSACSRKAADMYAGSQSSASSEDGYNRSTLV